MQNKVANFPVTPDPTIGQSPTPPATPPTPGPQDARATDGHPDQADLRLVIEEQAGSYVYMTVDRRTGDVVAQYPREEVLKLREGEDYEAGAVIRTRV
ncbi:hypothetical protein [Phenylobacterium aquaticum]|uniref:hypothetical protein n=1 Tax=Phenylobacterium aquaticum TaxID=1763816 RepID=UPI0026EB46CD|nr:hypothetical protein [Phenylobacterium aquaticum]